MIPPLMLSDFVFLQRGVSVVVGLFVVFLSSVNELRGRGVSRVSLFANSFFLWQIFYFDWQGLPFLFQLYLDFGVVIGIVALFSFLLRVKFSEKLYFLACFLYSSFSILALIVIYAIIQL